MANYSVKLHTVFILHAQLEKLFVISKLIYIQLEISLHIAFTGYFWYIKLEKLINHAQV